MKLKPQAKTRAIATGFSLSDKRHSQFSKKDDVKKFKYLPEASHEHYNKEYRENC